MTAISFVVPGTPIPKARPRVYGKRTITDPRTVAYEALVRMHALKARQLAKRSGIAWPLNAEYRVSIRFFVPDKRRRDVDNLLKSVLDACNAVLWDDDSQVSHIEAARQPAGLRGAEAAVLVEVLL